MKGCWECYLSSLTLEVFEIIVSHGGNRTTASASTPAGAHGVEISVLEVAALVVGRFVAIGFLLALLPLRVLLLLPLILLLQVVRSRVESWSMVPETFRAKHIRDILR